MLCLLFFLLPLRLKFSDFLNVSPKTSGFFCLILSSTIHNFLRIIIPAKCNTIPKKVQLNDLKLFTSLRSCRYPRMCVTAGATNQIYERIGPVKSF